MHIRQKNRTRCDAHGAGTAGERVSFMITSHFALCQKRSGEVGEVLSVTVQVKFPDTGDAKPMTNVHSE